MAKKTVQRPNVVPHIVSGGITANAKYGQTYHANLFVAMVTPEEFFLLVGDQTSPQEADMHWRFSASLNCAKRLHAMLGKLLAQYEEAWGAIPLTREPIKPLPEATPERKITKGARKRRRGQ